MMLIIHNCMHTGNDGSAGPILEKNGGDDETRTRGLCRDRVAVFWNLMILDGTDSPSSDPKELFDTAYRTLIGPGFCNV
jgi:hypothetical protein